MSVRWSRETPPLHSFSITVYVSQLHIEYDSHLNMLSASDACKIRYSLHTFEPVNQTLNGYFSKWCKSAGQGMNKHKQIWFGVKVQLDCNCDKSERWNLNPKTWIWKSESENLNLKILTGKWIIRKKKDKIHFKNPVIHVLKSDPNCFLSWVNDPRPDFFKKERKENKLSWDNLFKFLIFSPIGETGFANWKKKKRFLFFRLWKQVGIKFWQGYKKKSTGSFLCLFL